MAFLYVLVWAVAGVYGLFVVLRRRGYVQSLPASPGNDRLKGKHTVYLGAAILALIIAGWNLLKVLRSF